MWKETSDPWQLSHLSQAGSQDPWKDPHGLHKPSTSSSHAGCLVPRTGEVCSASGPLRLPPMILLLSHLGPSSLSPSPPSGSVQKSTFHRGHTIKNFTFCALESPNCIPCFWPAAFLLTLTTTGQSSYSLICSTVSLLQECEHLQGKNLCLDY